MTEEQLNDLMLFVKDTRGYDERGRAAYPNNWPDDLSNTLDWLVLTAAEVRRLRAENEELRRQLSKKASDD